MNTYEEVEYSNVILQLDVKSIHHLIERLVDAGFSVAWKEAERQYTLSIQTEGATKQLTFDKQCDIYKLRNRSYNIKNPLLSEVLQKFIYEVKGHAILKQMSAGQLIVQNIRYGEPIRIVEIKGRNKKVVFEKECIVGMDQVLEALRRTDAEERIPMLMKEIDEKLALLNEALMRNQADKIAELKRELEKRRIEMIMLEV